MLLHKVRRVWANSPPADRDQRRQPLGIAVREVPDAVPPGEEPHEIDAVGIAAEFLEGMVQRPACLRIPSPRPTSV
jgi:hypothetical protein